MDKSYLNFFLNENVDINLSIFIQNLLVALILSLVLRFVYIKFSNSLSNKREFSRNFIVLGITTCLVITIVKSSLALSLGLVGALSIVRFRAAIKEPEELVFLFLVIAVGLGAGAGQTLITICGTIVALLSIIVFYKFDNKTVEKNSENMHLSIRIENAVTGKRIDELTNLISKEALYLELTSLNKNQDFLIINFLIKTKDLNKLNFINDLIIKKYPKSNITISKDHDISL